MFYLDCLIRIFDAGGSEVLDGLNKEVMGTLQEYDNYTILAHPIRNLVGMSLGSILHSAEFAKGKQRAVVSGYKL